MGPETERSSQLQQESLTSLSLLAALRDNVRQHEAWGRFVQRYGPRINRWCRQWGLQAVDAEDVTQNVLLQLARQMETFEYNADGRFRSWLKTVAWRAWAKFLDAQRRNPARPGAPDALEVLNSQAAHDGLMQSLDDEADREVLDLAMERVRSRVQPNTFEAFRLMSFDGLSGKEVADRLEMKTGAVFVARSRIDRMLSEEVRRIDPEAARQPNEEPQHSDETA